MILRYILYYTTLYYISNNPLQFQRESVATLKFVIEGEA